MPPKEIEEFAAEGFTHIECRLPSVSHDETEANQLASAHLDGTLWQRNPSQ
jgi:hypothetical protein